jgi:hypothetical protein
LWSFVRFPLRISLALAMLACLAMPRAAVPQEPASPPQQAATPAVDAAALPERLLDRQPFDRITLDASNDNAVIETVLLELPGRRVPDPLPKDGRFELRQLSQPTIPYAVDWSAIAKIELYEQMLLAEATRLTQVGDFVAAFEILAFLRTNYADLPGLEQALDDHLWRDASSAFAAGDGDGAWPALVALYERNPAFPRLANAVQAVSDSLINQRLAEQKYSAARDVLTLVERHFTRLELPSVAGWRQQFEQDANAQITAARTALADRQFDDARAAAMRAEAMAPGLEEARELLRQIQLAAPEMHIGVTQLGVAAPLVQTPGWAAARLGPLTNPRLVEMVDFGAEGGVYACPFGELQTDTAGLETTLRLSPASLQRGLTPDAVSRQLTEAAGQNGRGGHEDLAAALDSASLAGGRDVRVAWRRTSLHPETFLQIPLRQLVAADRGAGLWFDASPTAHDAAAHRYVRNGDAASADGAPAYLVERAFADDDAALNALSRGEIDAIDRVPPWQLATARQARGVELLQYALPTVHVLIPSPDNPLLAMREFRRALCYGTDRAGIVRDIFLGGESAPGYVTLSGPFPAGMSLGDPVGYGYNSTIAPRPYEPRLAALLAGVARATLAKRNAEERKQRGEVVEPVDPTVEPQLPPAEPLILAHAADPLARVACQALKLQLDRVGLPIKLVEMPVDPSAAHVKYDLLYAELAVWEPLVDARRLLGASGVAGRSSALMTAALDNLARCENWNEARSRLHEIHRIAHFDLPLIPLWQTVNYFGRRTWLAGVGDRPLTLYQNLGAWRKEFNAELAKK